MISSTTLSQECDINFDYVNTGSNMIIMINQNALDNDVLQVGDSLGAFMFHDNSWVCVGSLIWTGTQQTLVVWGNDAASSEIDGLSPLSPIILKAESSGIYYDVSYAPEITFQVNGIEILNSNLNFTPFCDLIGNVFGCTESNYEEYNEFATFDDGSCENITFISGCTNDSYLEYNPNATVFDNSCETLIVYGCIDSNYFEYSSDANVDDGSCLNQIILGCTDSNYLEYDPNANFDDESCLN